MSLDSFRLEADPAQNAANSPDKEAVDNVSVSFNGLRIEITTAINTTGMRLVWVVPFSTLLMESLQNILLPLLLTIGLLALTLFGFTTFRHYSGRRNTGSVSAAPPPPTASFALSAQLMKRLSLCCRWACWCTIRKPIALLSATRSPIICCLI